MCFLPQPLSHIWLRPGSVLELPCSSTIRTDTEVPTDGPRPLSPKCRPPSLICQGNEARGHWNQDSPADGDCPPECVSAILTWQLYFQQPLSLLPSWQNLLCDGILQGEGGALILLCQNMRNVKLTILAIFSVQFGGTKCIHTCAAAAHPPTFRIPDRNSASIKHQLPFPFPPATLLLLVSPHSQNFV